MAASKKKISGYIKLQFLAGKANPAPPIGPALGQHGVNIMGFCKEFNAKSQKLKNHRAGMTRPIVLSASS